MTDAHADDVRALRVHVVLAVASADGIELPVTRSAAVFASARTGATGSVAITRVAHRAGGAIRIAHTWVGRARRRKCTEPRFGRIVTTAGDGAALRAHRALRVECAEGNRPIVAGVAIGRIDGRTASIATGSEASARAARRFDVGIRDPIASANEEPAPAPAVGARLAVPGAETENSFGPAIVTRRAMRIRSAGRSVPRIVVGRRLGARRRIGDIETIAVEKAAVLSRRACLSSARDRSRRARLGRRIGNAGSRRAASGRSARCTASPRPGAAHDIARRSTRTPTATHRARPCAAATARATAVPRAATACCRSAATARAAHGRASRTAGSSRGGTADSRRTSSAIRRRVDAAEIADGHAAVPARCQEHTEDGGQQPWMTSVHRTTSLQSFLRSAIRGRASKTVMAVPPRDDHRPAAGDSILATIPRTRSARGFCACAARKARPCVTASTRRPAAARASTCSAAASVVIVPPGNAAW